MDEAYEQIARLIRALDHPDKKTIRQAVDALVALAPDAPEICGEVAAAMARAPAEKRWPMAYVLAQIAPPSDACFDALECGLDAPDPDIRWAVVVLLVRVAERHGDKTVERLVSLLKSGTATQRRMAVYALRDIATKDAPSQQAVRGALGDPEPLVRVAALTSLKIFPKVARDALAELLRMLESDPDARVRAADALALAHSGAPTEEIAPALQRAAESGDGIVAKAARAGLEVLKRRS